MNAVLDFFKKTDAAGTGELMLEYELQYLAKWGKVHVMSRDNNTWYLSLEVTFPGMGKMEFKADPDMGATPSAAAASCRAKLAQAIKQLNLKEPV